MDIGVLLAVAVIWTVAAITPGPNFFITVHTAIGLSGRFSAFTVLGIVVGTLVWSVSGFLGISLLFTTAPVLYVLLKLIGGLYLVYVGLSLFFKKTNRGQKSLGMYTSGLSCFRLGLFTNLFNPKTAAFMTSLFAATIPGDASILLGVVTVLMICSISALWYLLVAALFSRDFAKREYEKRQRLIEKIAGTIFVGFGFKLALVK